MNSVATVREPRKNVTQDGVVYRTVCQNPGCGHTFDLRITAANASVLGGTIPCPRCHRRGGTLKSQGRIADKLLAAKLVFRMTGVAPLPDEDERLANVVELPY